MIAGAALRTLIAFATVGVAYDIDSMFIVGTLPVAELLDVYSTVNTDSGYRWPYPPGFFPWIELSVATQNATPLPFHGMVQLPAIAADAALAFVVQGYLGANGAGERARLAAGALVALGPVFVAVAGYHGQIDSLAILPAVGALIAWERSGSNRAVIAGLLLGAGIALKTFPILMLLALLPTIRSKREGIRLLAATAAIPVVLLAPFALSDPAGVETLRKYQGVPGLGGLSLLVQPGAAEQWILAGVIVDLNGANELLLDYGPWLLAAGLAALGAALWWRRVPPLDASVLLWLAVLALSANFGLRYLVWALPFLIMAGHLRAVAWIQAIGLPLALITYGFPFESSWPAYPYVPLALGLWAALAVWAVRLSAGAFRAPRAPPVAPA